MVNDFTRLRDILVYKSNRRGTHLLKRNGEISLVGRRPTNDRVKPTNAAETFRWSTDSRCSLNHDRVKYDNLVLGMTEPP